jgi:hypothetical protein
MPLREQFHRKDARIRDELAVVANAADVPELSTDEVTNKWELFTLSAPVPAANQSLEVIAPTREDNACTMPA